MNPKAILVLSGKRQKHLAGWKEDFPDETDIQTKKARLHGAIIQEADAAPLWLPLKSSIISPFLCAFCFSFLFFQRPGGERVGMRSYKS